MRKHQWHYRKEPKTNMFIGLNRFGICGRKGITTNFERHVSCKNCIAKLKKAGDK